MSHLQIIRSCLLLAPKWLVCRGRGLSGSAYAVWTIRKDLLVMSQWVHITRTGSLHRQLLPSLLLWQSSPSMGEAGGRCHCFVWKLSLLSVACGKWRQWQQQNMVCLSSSGLGNSKHTASPSYHAPWFKLSPGLCTSWVWNSPRRTGLSSSHCGASAVMNSGSHPEHPMSWYDDNRHAKKEWGYMEPQSQVVLTPLVL
jgi:hypothetical protein